MTNGINSALSGSHTLLPDDLSLEGEVAADGTVGLGVGGFGLKLQGEASVSAVVTQQDGTTTFEATGKVSVSAEGNATFGRASVSGGVSTEHEITYSVTIPTDAFSEDVAKNLDPGDPSTWPPGTIVRIDQGRQDGRNLEFVFNGISAGNNVKTSQNSSVVLTHEGDGIVRVTTGSTEGIDAHNSLGADWGWGDVKMSNDTSLEGSTVTEVVFDTSTEEGREQFDHYLEHGTLKAPADPNSPGIQSMTKTEVLDFESTSQINANLGPFSIDLDGGSNTANSTRITNMQTGESTITTVQQIRDNPPLVIIQEVDASGNETGRTYSISIEVTEENREFVQVAGEIDAEPGSIVHITFTHSQLESHIENDVYPAVDAQAELGSTDRLDNLRVDPTDPQSEITPASYVRGLTSTQTTNSHDAMETLAIISDGADGTRLDGEFVPLPATVTIDP